MFSRSTLIKIGALRGENLGHRVVAMIGNLCFTAFVLAVLIFTIIAATYQPQDPLFHSPDKISSFLTSSSNATFSTDSTMVRTGEDFNAKNHSSFSFVNITDLDTSLKDQVSAQCGSDEDLPIDCTDTEVFHSMMKAAIERFKDIHFYRFGKAVAGSNITTCDMAWRFMPKQGKASALYKDYRRFSISRDVNCTYSVLNIGEYHSGVNARKRKKNQKPGFLKTSYSTTTNTTATTATASSSTLISKEQEMNLSIPIVGDTVNDTLPMVESEISFSQGRYLLYSGGGDRCKSMDHYLWSFLCSLGEAQYLNRTLIMDLSICISSIYSLTNQDEEGKNFRFYFDFEHLKEAASVLDKDQFWSDWNRWEKKNKMDLYLVEDFRVTPMKLVGVENSLIMRKFGSIEPDNYWFRVCEGETEAVVQRPWHLLWKSRRLMEIVSAISSRMNWDFDSVHVVRGDKVRKKETWPNLEKDTAPEAILLKLQQNQIEEGRQLYIATDERDLSLFDPLKGRYSTHFLNHYSDLWDENSEWYTETSKLNNGVPVEFDGYMKVSVDTEVFLKGKKQIETFNDLTSDCKDGINSCTKSVS